MDGNIKELELAAMGKGTAGNTGTAVTAGSAVVDVASAKPKQGVRRGEPDLEAAQLAKPADVGRLEIPRNSKWRGR